jgi:glyoxylase-like metal-dependent hydrolase (beta-lactamase superfamily II)
VDVRSFGRVKVLIGEKNGKYPYGNSILIDDDVTVLLDPSLMIRACEEELPARKIDMLFNSHCHKDHGVGNSLFPETPLYMHPLDAPAPCVRLIRSLRITAWMKQARKPASR